jgi:hypothetical protein
VEKKFRVLGLICNLQIVSGILIIAAAVIALLFALVQLMNPDQNMTTNRELLLFALSGGGFITGLSVIAMAQVYRCLMQVEINTRPKAASPVVDEQREVVALPQANLGTI